jgi:uncharacterized protein YsxB (DUF464 family)
MAEYRLIENNKKNLLNKKMLKSLPLIIIAVLAGMGISFFQIAQSYNSHIFLIVILPTLLICAGATFIGLKFGLKIYKENHLDVVFSIEDSFLKIIRKGRDIISASKEEINKIEEYNDETIIIFLKNKQKIILNKNIENYNNMKSELNEFFEISKKDKKPNNSFYTILSLGIIILYIVFCLSADKAIVILSGVLVVGIVIFSIVKTLLDKSVDKRIKIMFLIAIILLADIIKRIIEVL